MAEDLAASAALRRGVEAIAGAVVSASFVVSSAATLFSNALIWAFALSGDSAPTHGTIALNAAAAAALDKTIRTRMWFILDSLEVTTDEMDKLTCLELRLGIGASSLLYSDTGSQIPGGTKSSFAACHHGSS